MRVWMLLLAGSLLGMLSGCSHDPNHDINMEQARAAARRVHAPPPAGTKRMPGFGG